MIHRRGAVTQAPRIGEVRLTDLDTGDPADLARGVRIDGSSYRAIEAEQIDLSHAVVMECQFSDVGADEADLRSTRLRDSRIEHARFPSLRGARGDWRDVRIEGARIGSAELYENSWAAVHFVDCKLTYLNLRGSTLRDVAFTRCTIEELDLGGARLQSVAFLDSSVQILDVQRAELADVDLRGAQLHRITGLDRLAGTTVTPSQLYQLAPLIAADFGLLVEDGAPSEIP